ncbi:MAG: restriction endonuclease subunit S [Veillonella sp.]|nr:restriction endonuclease subunit S [Veillonella sp.]
MYLKELVDIQMGQSPESKFYNYDKIGLPFYQGKADFGRINPTPKMWCSKSKKEAKPNDILISVRAPVGDLNINKEQSCIGRGLAAITCKSDVDMMYLYYHLKYLKPQLRHISTGSTFESINRSQLENLIITYKSYAEQIKISNTLNVVQRQIEVKENLLSLCDLLIKSRFVEMFGDPNASRTKYKLVPIHMVTDCMVPGRDKPKSFTGEIPWITINDLNINGYTNKSKLGLGLTIDEVKEVNRKCVPQGSVLMSCVGNLGLCSIASVDVVINQQLHSYQCNELINNLYLMYYLSFKNTYMNKVASSTTVLYMNKNACNNIPVLLPPIELQISFAKYLNQINKLKSDVQKSIDETQLLMDSLMQEYFG